MSIENQVQLLEKTYQLHQSLLEISKQKEQLIKDNNIDGMRQVLMGARKHVKAIQELEEKRVIATSGWFRTYAPEAEEQTIQQVIDHLQNNEEKEQLQAIYENFIYVLADLKNQEKLNRELMEQSLQFVELSLDLLKPNHEKNMNYDKKQVQQNKASQSVFDSKA